MDNDANVNAGVNLVTACDSNESTDSCDKITTATQLQLTTGNGYIRNPSMITQGTNMWLFYANDTNASQNGNGCDETDVNCDNDEYVIYVIKSTDDGKTWGTPVQVSDTIANFNQRDISAVSDGTDLYAFVSSGSSVQDIYYYKSINGGATWTAGSAVKTGAIQSGHFDATYYSGKFYITYLTSSALVVNHATIPSETWTTVSNALPNTHNSAVTKAMFDGNNLTVVWENGGNGIYYSTSSTPQTQDAWSSSVKIAKSEVSGYGDYDPVLYKFENKYYLFWAPDGDNHQRIDYKVADSLDELTGTEAFVFSGSTQSNEAWDYWPEVTQDDAGNLIVFYTSENSVGTSPTRVNGNIWMASFGDKERVIPANTELGLYTFKGFPKMVYPAKYTITTTVDIAD